MRYLRAIVGQPILIGLLLSVAAHAAFWYSRSTYIPAEPRIQTGRTVVQLTLLPSAPAQSRSHAREEATPTAHHAAAPKETSPEESVASRLNPVPSMPIPEPKVTPPDSEPVSTSFEQVPVSEAMESPSPEQDASPEREKGVITEATARSSLKPEYPRVSRRRGEEGRVTLRIQVMPDGTAGVVELLHSSGHQRLDKAAIIAAQQTEFAPARRDGNPEESILELSYTFRLTHD